MLTVRESRTGTLAQIRPSRSGGLFLYATGSLPAALLIDVVRRMEETRGVTVFVDWAGAGPPHAADLTLRPPEGIDARHDLAIGGPDPGRDRARCWLDCGDMAISGVPAHDWAAVRLTVLRLAARRDDLPAEVDVEAIARSAQVLARIRESVADWARAPSRPACASYVTRFRAAIDDDLDTDRAVGVLDDLARDPGIPDGSKFETAVHLDLVLALDLGQDIGR
jgi:hypothetical protein